MHLLRIFAAMYTLLRQFLFLLSPEKAHDFSMRALVFINTMPLLKYFIQVSVSKERVAFQYKDLTFYNKIGLAAGFDKNAKYLHVLKHLGFGHVEIGTVTPLGQPGNPKPRLFRLKKDEAIINRMGFNNDGMEVVAKRLERRPNDLIVGGNIGKNKITENHLAHEDYLKCFVRLYHLVDYFTINVSSPNTPGLRALQGKDELIQILEGLMLHRKTEKVYKPVFLKIAPDLEDSQIVDAVEVVNELDLDGIIANNTTISREGLKSDANMLNAIGAGGLSGKPLRDRSNAVCSLVKSALKNDKVLIGVGGIMSAQDATERLNSGADLVQVYTGFIYGGLNLIKECNHVN